MFKKQENKANIENAETLEQKEMTEGAENEQGIKDEGATCNPFIQNEDAELEDEMKQLDKNIQTELETLKNQYVRLAADFDNYRKRQTHERECLLKYGAEDTLKKLLPLLDTFERAQKSVLEMDDSEKIKESYNMVSKQLVDALEKLGLQKIETVGKEFDPVYHEAAMQTPTNDYPDHTIILELQSGYTLCDKVVRPALVNVAVNQ